MAEYALIRLDTKPSAQLCYRFIPSPQPCAALVVFLNGLGMPQTSWTEAIGELQQLRQSKQMPSVLTYDRFGQGQTTDRDPDDEGAEDPTHAHDCMAAVEDLHQLLLQISSQKLGIKDLASVTLIVVSNSIGAALTRLYAQTHPGTVSGILILDSVLANSDFVSIFPDPDAPGFDAGSLPEGITPESLRGAREMVGGTLHPRNGSPEGLSRRNLASLLPDSDGPALRAPGGGGPFVTVAGHDFETFAEAWSKKGMPRALVTEYVNPYWHRYNQGLVRITEESRAKGPLQAPNADHFIQRDNPQFVAEELDELITKVCEELRGEAIKM